MTRIAIEDGVNASTKHHNIGGRQKIKAKHATQIEEVTARTENATQNTPSTEIRQHILGNANRTNYMMECARLKGLM